MSYTDQQTAHIWSMQTRPAGKSSNGNLWFQGRTIWSYGTHYCAGYALHDCNGGTVWLYNLDRYNLDRYSVTTSGKHLPAVRRAIPGKGYGVDNLTELAKFLDYVARPGDTKAQRRARAFPEVRDVLLRCWPGELGAVAILAALGSTAPERNAATLAARHAKAQAELQAAIRAKKLAARAARKAAEARA